jgi:hypothetical protein
MAAFWCVNFDSEEDVLRHGVQEHLWLMQYQYSHNGHTYQGHPDQLPATTKNWRAAGKINPGDWLVAYLPPKTVFAVGKVIPRRNRERHLNQQTHQDTIARTTEEHSHNHLQGLVEYRDAGALYEDFTDRWNLPVTSRHSELPEVWRYSQRIDVEEWLHLVESGIQVKGPWRDVPPYMIQLAVFEIPEAFFETIRMTLQQAAEG